MGDIGLLGGLLGAISLGFGIWIVSRRNKCNLLIQGVFVNHHDYSNSAVNSYAPVFRYCYNGINYERQSFDVISKKLANTFISGQAYPIFINPNNPYDFVVNKKFNGSDLCMIGIGLFFMFFAVIYAFMN